MAHEIAHLVGSVHDGSTNNDSTVNMLYCPASEKKIMTPISGTRMVQEFSYCSTVQVAQFILIGKGSCLQTNITEMVTTKLTFDHINKTKPSLDEFCTRHYTEYIGTRYVEYEDERLSLKNCMITCTETKRRGYVIINDAPDGTSCNKTRPRAICINGKCTRVKGNRVQTFGDDVKDSVKFLPRRL
ncbi:hypothetical protein MTO96_033054 [Rhipicephalus appendiculatus]